jgi:hypothetical protein
MVRGEHEGRIYMRQGKIYYAVIDDNHELGPQKSFNRIIAWEQGEFELQPPDEQDFPIELGDSTEHLLMDALRQLDEFRRIQSMLPGPDQALTISVPLEAPLRDLSPDELDVVQLALNWGSMQGVLDHVPQDDVTAGTMVASLMQRGYLRIA